LTFVPTIRAIRAPVFYAIGFTYRRTVGACTLTGIECCIGTNGHNVGFGNLSRYYESRYNKCIERIIHIRSSLILKYLFFCNIRFNIKKYHENINDTLKFSLEFYFM